jgi:phosphoribosylaminoimidazolecarboxamide formyltransferase/IMP cyclohydrolase
MSRHALVSVSDKTNLEVLAPRLIEAGWTVLSTGGTARALRELGCAVTEVSEHIGFPEVLDGRVKTLHPRVFAGVLATDSEDHQAELDSHGIPRVDLVVVNLYPFRETIARADVTAAEAVEQIDIGGPSLIRAAAKNHDRVTVVVDPADYARVAEALAAGGPDLELRRELAVAAFAHTAAYDAAIAAHLPGLLDGQQRESAAVAEGLLRADARSLRYGENPHQRGELYVQQPSAGLASCRQHQGKELSFNNLGDASGAWRLVCDLPSPGAVVIKHANPCGVGLADDMAEAFRLARATDPISAFGGVIAANRPVGAAFAEAVVEQFAEVVIAPGYDAEALEVFGRKRNLRVLEAAPAIAGGRTIRSIDGGWLVQDADAGWDDEKREVVTDSEPSEEELAALELAWRVCKHVGSNAIVVGNQRAILGVGAGQMSRVDAARIAVDKAREHDHDLAGSVAASDAFFPFPDGIEALAEAGVRAVIQPGGSIRDEQVVEACNRLGVAMVFTGRRHFRH